MKIGVISDTHGLLRPEVFDEFVGVDHILHAGDIVDPAILDDLASIAPVTAVWGNCDGWMVRELTTEDAELDLGGVRIAMTHGHLDGSFEGIPDRFPDARVVVHGHSHWPRADWRGEVLLLNPGSAGPRAGGKPVCLAVLEIGESSEIDVRHVDLESGRVLRP